MATKKRKRFDEGGITEAADKAAGLKASAGEKVGFFERLRMGNIDDPRSEAYNRFGAGRAKADRDMANEAAAMKVVDASRASGTGSADSGEFYEAGSGVVNDTKPDAPKPVSKPRVNAQTSKPAASTSQPTKGSGPYRVDSGPGNMGSSYSNEGRSSKTAKVDTSNHSNEGRGREMTAKQRAEYAIDSARPTAEQTQKGLETASTVMGGAGLKTLQGLAKKLATPKTATYTQPALAAPTKRLPYDKAGAVTRAREARAAARQEEMLKENAARYGLDPKAPGYEAAAGAIRKDLGGKDFSFKRGGKVQAKAPMKKMASGGSTSKASSRADGIAQRGKTRGKIY